MTFCMIPAAIGEKCETPLVTELLGCRYPVFSNTMVPNLVESS